jgi:hypothetical protein
LPVEFSVPCDMSRGVATVFTPEPIDKPAGNCVPWSEVADPARRRFS